MIYEMTVGFECYHKPSETWHNHKQSHGVRAVSRKHALNKAVKVAASLPGYSDREGHPEWLCSAFAKFKESA